VIAGKEWNENSGPGRLDKDVGMETLRRMKISKFAVKFISKKESLKVTLA
jgi:hypothetical protein